MDCIANQPAKQFKDLIGFNDYFKQEAYDAFKMDRATGNNLLSFTLAYIYNKLNWKAEMPLVNEERFLNLAVHMQKAYRNNFYHSHIHAADVS